MKGCSSRHLPITILLRDRPLPSSKRLFSTSHFQRCDRPDPATSCRKGKSFPVPASTAKDRTHIFYSLPIPSGQRFSTIDFAVCRPGWTPSSVPAHQLAKRRIWLPVSIRAYLAFVANARQDLSTCSVLSICSLHSLAPVSCSLYCTTSASAV